MYEHSLVTKVFPPSFYQSDNSNYNDYKELEKRIFDNRSRIVELKKILIPFGSSHPLKPKVLEDQNSGAYVLNDAYNT